MIARQYDTTLTKTRSHDITKVITRQYDGENTIVYRIIIMVLSYYREFVIVLSRFHHRNIGYRVSDQHCVGHYGIPYPPDVGLERLDPVFISLK